MPLKKAENRPWEIDWEDSINDDVTDVEVSDSEEAEELYVPECAEAEEADFVLSVSGDSMEPTFHDGDKIYVSKQDAIDVGEIGIFIINGDAYVKELGTGKLISHNEKYRPISLKSDDSIYCCGRVLGVVEGVK